MKQPDPKIHLIISIIKSIIRIIAGLALVHSDIIFAGMALIIAELLGIAEEMF